MIRFQPISVEAIPAKELREVTDNFGSKALIGEGTYGGVFRGVLSDGQAVAIKKLDTSKQPEQEFLAQVCISLWTVTAGILISVVGSIADTFSHSFS